MALLSQISVLQRICLNSPAAMPALSSGAGPPKGRIGCKTVLRRISQRCDEVAAWGGPLRLALRAIFSERLRNHPSPASLLILGEVARQQEPRSWSTDLGGLTRQSNEECALFLTKERMNTEARHSVVARRL